MSAADINAKLKETFPTITFTGLTGDGAGITWDSTGAVSKSPKGHGHQGRRLRCYVTSGTAQRKLVIFSLTKWGLPDSRVRQSLFGLVEAGLEQNTCFCRNTGQPIVLPADLCYYGFIFSCLPAV